MKLNELKSAREVVDHDEIKALLAKAHQNQPSLSSFVRIDKDGKAVVTKRSASVLQKAEAGLPTYTQEALLELAAKRGFPDPLPLVERTLQYWASDERVDGHGDIVLQDWDFKEYEKSPILAFSHNWQDPPIGGSFDWAVKQRASDDYDGPALWLLSFFATPEQYAWADTIYRLAKARILRGGSVGFYSRKVIDITDPDEREALGLGRWGYVLGNNMLVEFSPTTVGANAGALSIYNMAKSAGLLQVDDVPVLRELVRRESQMAGGKESWKSTDNTIRAFVNTVFPGTGLKAHKDFDAPIFEIPLAGKPIARTSSVPVDPTVVKDVAILEQKIDAFIAMVMDSLSGMTATIEDIRSNIETLLPDEVVPGSESALSGEGASKQGTLLQRAAAHTRKAR